jgi:molybdate transport system substrate-binding protein
MQRLSSLAGRAAVLVASALRRTAGVRALLAGAVAAGLLAGAGPAVAADGGSVVVFAAASLREAFEAAAPAFTARTGVAVTFSFGGSDTLVTQLKQGAPADVFASANDAQMKVAADAGLLAGSPRTFAHNRLVLIVPRANPGKVRGLADLARPGVTVVLAAPTVPVGSYARAAFRRLNGQPGFAPDFDAAVERNVVSNELDVKAVATKVSLGEADAGVVYATDVTHAIAVRVTKTDFPASASPDATYPIAVLRNAQNAAGARAFVDFVLSRDGQAFLRARGFVVP